MTPADRLQARAVVRQADHLADKHRWTRWLTGGLSRIIRAALDAEG